MGIFDKKTATTAPKRATVQDILKAQRLRRDKMSSELATIASRDAENPTLNYALSKVGSSFGSGLAKGMFGEDAELTEARRLEGQQAAGGTQGLNALFTSIQALPDTPNTRVAIAKFSAGDYIGAAETVEIVVENNLSRVKLEQDELKAKVDAFDLSPEMVKLVGVSEVAQNEALTSANNAERILVGFSKAGDKYTGGAVGGLISAVKGMFGTRDELEWLKTAAISEQLQNLLSMLPPGVASDRDIDLARQGVPPNDASEDEWVAYFTAKRNVSIAIAENMKAKVAYVHKYGNTDGFIATQTLFHTDRNIVEQEAELEKVLKWTDEQITEYGAKKQVKVNEEYGRLGIKDKYVYDHKVSLNKQRAKIEGLKEQRIRTHKLVQESRERYGPRVNPNRNSNSNPNILKGIM
jgi:hypothetical protein